MQRKRAAWLLGVIMMMGSLVAGCGRAQEAVSDLVEDNETVEVTDLNAEMAKVNIGEEKILDDKYQTYYEVFVRSFYDSDQDGVGDLKGLIGKLDYINDGDEKTTEDLGATGIWLMPVMPSTTYHKYDVTDYTDIDPEYGTMEDFDKLIEESHKRGIRVIIDYVLNHTSSQHPWFKQACEYIEGLNGQEPSEEDCPYFGYYHFTKEKKGNAYYQVKDTEWYYEAQFWSEMPDLNLENEAVQREFDAITEFWVSHGVDGFRLDAVSQYQTGSIQGNIEDIKWITDMIKARKEDAYVVGEDWEAMDIYSQYYASGIDSLFNFDFGNSTGIIASSLNGISGSNASTYGKAVGAMDKVLEKYSDTAVDAPFYTNHDMGRSAGYYSGDGSENKTKLSGAMNLMMSGCAFVYYGEELGMKGSGKDENKRAPMYWAEDADAVGMCKGPEGMDEIKMKFPSLEEQEKDGDSVYCFYKQAMHLRNIYPEIARGKTIFVSEASNEAVCVLKKEYEVSELELVFNMSEKEQQIDLSVLEDYGTDIEKLEIKGELLTQSGKAECKEGKVTIPAYSMLLLKEK